MALKGDRYEFQTDISFFVTAAVATRGGVMSYVTGGSGAALDQAQAVVAYAAASSGAKPAGVLMNDVVNYDLTRQHINFAKDEVQLGNKVRLLKKGFIVTNNITGTPVVGDSAYMTSSGNFLPYNTIAAGASNFLQSPNPLLYPLCGTFLSSKDEDGYAKVEINIA